MIWNFNQYLLYYLSVNSLAARCMWLLCTDAPWCGRDQGTPLNAGRREGAFLFLVFHCDAPGSSWGLSHCCALPLAWLSVEACADLSVKSYCRNTSEGGFYSGFSALKKGEGSPQNNFWLTGWKLGNHRKAQPTSPRR